ncbi:MAG: sigma-70 family RNA polymerase sigma factor [Verrucomicrobiota bacterium]
MNEFTQILGRVEHGDPQAAAELIPIVYDELRRLAAQKLANEKPGQTLQATGLVHEAWIKLAESTEQRWQNRRHFFAAAAEAMRRILIDRARKRKRTRHGHGLERIDLQQVEIAESSTDEQLLAVDEALQRLAAESPERAELVKLRYYVGLSIPEAAEALGISESTAKRQWNYVRLWLFKELQSTVD